jgi:hypothetical protein
MSKEKISITGAHPLKTEYNGTGSMMNMVSKRKMLAPAGIISSGTSRKNPKENREMTANKENTAAFR